MDNMHRADPMFDCCTKVHIKPVLTKQHRRERRRIARDVYTAGPEFLVHTFNIDSMEPNQTRI